ncbi:retrovirus-related pol polyprotein from transposon TNT 1-94 [Tanacetum coccineum]
MAEEDRISSLQDWVLLEIISRIKILDKEKEEERLMSTKEVIKTTATISKRWQHLWTRLPSLIFIDEDVIKHRGYPLNEVTNYFSFIDKTLTQCPTDVNLKKFKLQILDIGHPTSQVNSLIRYAIMHNVQEIDLRITGKFRFDDELFFNNSCLINQGDLDEDSIGKFLSGSPCLETLESKDCFLVGRIPKSLFGNIGVVERLSCNMETYERFSYDDELFFNNSSLISIKLSRCVFDPPNGSIPLDKLKGIDVTSKSIKNLVLSGYEYRHPGADNYIDTLEINAPYILSLTIEGKMYLEKFFLENVSSLVKAVLNYLGSNYFAEELRRDQYDIEEELLQGLLSSLGHVNEIVLGDYNCLQRNKVRTFFSSYFDLIYNSYAGSAPAFDVAMVRKIGGANRAKSTESLSQTYTHYKTLLNELANDGVNLSKHEINVGFVNSLPEKWLTFSQGLRNANHTQTLDLADIYGRFVYEDNLIQKRTTQRGEKINEKWLTSSKKVSQCISEQIPHQKKKFLGGELFTESSSKKNENENLFIPASMGKILVPESQAVNESLESTKTLNVPESSKDSEAESLTPLPPLKNIQGALPSSESVLGTVSVGETEPTTPSVPTEVKNTKQESKINKLTKLVQMLIDEKVNSTQMTQESNSKIQQTESSKSVDSSKGSQDSKPKVQNVGSSKSLRPKPIQKPQLKCKICHYTNHLTDDGYRILYYMICKREDHRTSYHEMYTASLKKNENYKA